MPPRWLCEDSNRLRKGVDAEVRGFGEEMGLSERPLPPPCHPGRKRGNDEDTVVDGGGLEPGTPSSEGVVGTGEANSRWNYLGLFVHAV